MIYNLNGKKVHNYDNNYESILKLLQAMCNDPVINRKVINILKMDSYPRHIVLSNWLEQLRRINAPTKLMQSLACLFDDNITKKVWTLINDHQINNTESD
jgi:hypothetical protein